MLAVSGLAPAKAQVAGSLAVESDYRLRGYSLSEGHPAATAQIGFDDPSGFYANLAGSLLIEDGDPGWLGSQVNIGFTKRLASDASIDLGLLRADYRDEDRRGGRNYTEAYVGLTARRVTARLFYSPDYFRDGTSTLYGEVETGYRVADGWRFDLHGGALAYLERNRPMSGRHDLLLDWRAALTRTLGRVELHGAVSGGGPGRDYYRGRARDKTAFTFGASWAF